jgi:microcystin-dependent protein
VIYTATERPTVGDLKMSMVSVDHIGWLKCDGRQVPIDAFRHLYYVVGRSFGTDVSDGYFRLPNPQGRVLGMVGQSAGTSDWFMGDVSGSETHTLTIPEMPTHNHDVTGNTTDDFGRTDISGAHTHTLTRRSNIDAGAYDTGDAQQDESSASTTDRAVLGTFSTSSAGAHHHLMAANGGDQPHNNIQPTIWIGSLFVYSGRLFRDAPSGGNHFPPQGPNTNIY